jgi:phosphoribosylanthranilate isomerase
MPDRRSPIPDPRFPIPTPHPPAAKICGLTNLEDALVAAAAGADFLGFIFYPPSKRAVTPATVAHISAALRGRPNCPILVGVFVDETAAAMAQILDQCQLDLAQLSGRETPGIVGDPSSELFGRCFKALKPTSLAEAQAEVEWYLPTEPQPGHPTLLIDAYHPSLPGGTGQTADWSIAAALAELTPGLMLAGGLNPNNVAQAIRQVRPFAVDVAGGVEARPGRKDHALIRAFIQNTKATADEVD